MGIPAALKLPKSTIVVVVIYVLCAAINAASKALQRIRFGIPGRLSSSSLSYVNRSSPAAAKGWMWTRKRVPPVESRESWRKGRMEVGGGELVCVVCLGDVGEGDEVRELRECLHSFHKGCLDGWVEEGHCTCPLCRTQFVFHGNNL